MAVYEQPDGEGNPYQSGYSQNELGVVRSSTSHPLTYRQAWPLFDPWLRTVIFLLTSLTV